MRGLAKQTSSVTWDESPDIETSSEGYARRFSGKVGGWFLKVQEEATLRMLDPYPGASILDVGGGHGQVTGSLVGGGFKLTVFGSSPACGQRIQRFVDEGACSFETGNLLNLPYPDRSFDVVMSYRLLPHVIQWQRLVAELTRVAKKAVIIEYPTKQSLNYAAPLLFGVKKRLEGNTRTFVCFNKKELAEEFTPLGFVTADRYPEFFLPMVLHRVLKLPTLSSTLEGACRATGLTRLFGSPVIMRLVREGC